MTSFLAILLFLILVVLAVPVLLLAVQVAATFMEKRRVTVVAERPRVGILVPAHNESAGLRPTLDNLKAQIRADDRILVIADNCDDDTADVARQAGVEVVVRTDTILRGKGYALDFGMRHMAADAPEIVMIVDADCMMGAGSIDYLASAAADSGNPAQALYLMHAPPDSGVMKQVAEFAWIVKNLVRPLGFHRLGLPCQLMGTGMAFPWTLLQQADLATGHIVEDMKLGIDLARLGHAPQFCPQATVTSYFPVSAEGTSSQRTRWEHGHLSLIMHDAPQLLASGLAHRQAGVVALSLDLMVPPIALLVMLQLAGLLVSLIFFALSSVAVPFVLSLLSWLLLMTSLTVSWYRYGRHILTFGTLMVAGLYVLKKIPVYVRFVVGRQVEWVRSKRDSE